MDAVGEILAEKQRESFPWAAGATLAAALHLAIFAAFFASSLGRPMRLAPPRAVAVRILQAGAIRAEAAKAAPRAPAEPVKPRIEKPPEEAPPPPSKKAVLLPAPPEKKKKEKPTPAPAAVTAPHAPDVSLPSSAESAGAGTAAAPSGAGGAAKIGGGAQIDQPDFKYDYYIEAVQMALYRSWLPTTATQIAPRVHFRINRDGTVADPQIVRSSGLLFADRTAIRAVLDATFPPLPADWSGPYIGLTVTFE
ncbi:MAG TPA: TonB family protein [Thermoanaerobaculia bacterium]|jgi:TonB family protein